MKKMLWLIVLFLIPLFSISAYGNGFNPPDGSWRFSGPAITGTLTLTPVSGNYLIKIEFTGDCKCIPVELELPQHKIKDPFPSLTGDDLIGLYIGDVVEGQKYGFLPLECLPPKFEGEGIIINAVSKFENSGTKITADIVMLFLMPKNEKK
jgi:hypothetical protein